MKHNPQYPTLVNSYVFSTRIRLHTAINTIHSKASKITQQRCPTTTEASPSHTQEMQITTTLHQLGTNLVYRCHTLPNTRAFTSTVYSQLSSLAKFLCKPTKTCAFHVSTQSPDLSSVTRLTCPGHSRARATTVYTWRQKIDTEPRPTH